MTFFTFYMLLLSCIILNSQASPRHGLVSEVPSAAPVSLTSAGAPHVRSSNDDGNTHGSGNSSGAHPLPKPDPQGPHPDPPKHRPGDPFPNPQHSGSGGSSSSSSSSVGSPASSLGSPATSPLDPAKAAEVSSRVLPAEVPTPAGFSIIQAPTPARARTRKAPLSAPTKAPTPVPVSVPVVGGPLIEPTPRASKFILKGRVACVRCSGASKSRYNHPRGISGVRVELQCTDREYNATSKHHGVFRMTFHRTVPSGFPNNCTVSVVASTLPQTCNIPVESTESNLLVPNLQSNTNTTATYTVPALEFSSTCA